MKKDSEWLKKGIEVVLYRANLRGALPVAESNLIYDDIVSQIDQLDELELLSEEWINRNKKDSGAHYIGYYVPIGRLHDLLVPKQEEVDQAYKDGYEKGKQHTFYKGYLEGLADKESEPEKVVVPQFVADWYESEGKRSSWWNWFYKWGRDESRTELESKTIRWMQDYNEEKFVDIFRYGYEVEAEQKYHVTDENDTLLCKSNGVVMTVGKLWAIGNEHEAEYDLTEQEIKDYDERYLAFKVPVEELEE